MKGLLEGKRAMVTGASRGIGRAVALAFAEAGAELLLTARDLTTLAVLAAEIEAGGTAGVSVRAPLLVPADLADPGAAAKLAEAAAAQWDALDVLVLNAGQLGMVTPIEDYPPALWDQVLRVNLTAPFLLVKALLPMLRVAESSSIIAVTSGLGRRGGATWGAYSVSKFGLEGLTQVLAEELAGSSVRLNLVNPGATRTDMRSAAFPSEDPDTLPGVESVVPPFVYLAADASKGVHGQRLDARGWSWPSLASQ